MKVIVTVKLKQPVDEIDAKMIEELESNLEDIQEVFSANFDERAMKAYLECRSTDPRKQDDEQELEIDKMAVMKAVNQTSLFQFGHMTTW